MKNQPSSGQPKRKVVEVAESTYQPRRAEMREKVDMPGASLRTVRRAFFRPVVVRRASPKS